MATVFEPISPVPPITTIFMAYPPLSMTGDTPMGTAQINAAVFRKVRMQVWKNMRAF
jgi:hypothetical protein